MASPYRVLALGGERTVLVELASVLQSAGAIFDASSETSTVVESAAQLAPHLVLAFAQPSPHETLRRVKILRDDPRFTRTPIVLVASHPPRGLRGISELIPDLSNIGELAQRVLRLLKSYVAAEPPPFEDALEEIETAQEIAPLPARILVVDDDPLLVKLFSVAMRNAAFAVEVADDGLSGLEVALRSRPDLVVADLNMPRLDGWGLLRAIRVDHRLGETPVVFLSAHDDYRERLKALAAGAQDYIAKGVRLEGLVARIRTLLAARDTFLGAVIARERVTGKIEEIGVQWTLRNAANAKASGTICFRDAFGVVWVALNEGELVWARAETGREQVDGAQALTAMVALRSGEMLFTPAEASSPRNLTGDAVALIEDAALKNNETEAAAVEQLLVRAKQVEVDPPLFRLYEQLGPPESREIAELVRQGLPPREVLARLDRSPMEIEATIRDLVRRRVLRLSP